MNEIPDFLRVANRDKPFSPPPAKLVHSYSALNCYADVCPHQYWHRYILKDIKFVETDAIRAGNEVHSAFEYRLEGKKPFPPHLQNCERFAQPLDAYPKAVEQWYAVTESGTACESRSSEAFVRGKLDCTLIKGDRAHLFDWKSGSSRYEKPFELEIGAMLLKAKHPYLTKITGQYAWIKEDRLGQSYDLSDTDRTWRSVTTIVGQIRQDQQRGEFEKRKSGLCGWCQVKSCEHNTNANA